MRVLVTGMSGTGKSSVVAELGARGHLAYDVDDGLTHFDPADGRWHWSVAAVQRVLADAGGGPVFLAGCSEEQRLFDWDLRVLLTTPTPVLLQRLAGRTGNAYGSAPTERRQVLEDIAEVEPLLRRSADVVLDTTMPVAEVVAQVLRAAEQPRP